MITREEKENVQKLLTEVIEFYQGKLEDVEELGEAFHLFTGLPNDTPPLLVEWASQTNGVPIEVVSMKKIANAFFDVIMVAAAMAYGHGLKQQATEIGKAASESAQ